MGLSVIMLAYPAASARGMRVQSFSMKFAFSDLLLFLTSALPLSPSSHLGTP
jgi:hypothetical protein